MSVAPPSPGIAPELARPDPAAPRLRRWRPAPRAFHVRAPADRRAPQTMRHRCGRWLAELGWPELDREVLVLALGEAVANVVEHAYGPHAVGVVEVDGRILLRGPRRRIQLTVTDFGQWRPAHRAERRCSGFGVMRWCTREIDLRTAPTGTRLTLVSHAWGAWAAGLGVPHDAVPLRSPAGASGEGDETPPLPR